jgi:phage baseplate assembly protein W
MKNTYYRLPLRFDQITQKKQHDTCLLNHSIAQNLHLIISTYRGEVAYSDEFGCSLWDEEFNIQLNLRWKEILCDSIRQAMTKFEKRLAVRDVKVSMQEQSKFLEKESVRIRRIVQIEISGVISKTNEPFNFRDTIFISPLAQK